MSGNEGPNAREAQTKIQRKYFDEVAALYAAGYHVTPVQLAWNEEFYRYIKNHGFAKPRVLEIGAGTGNLARLFNTSEVEYYVGVDLSVEMLRYARNTCPSALFAAADIFKLPFSDESFDIVIVAGTLHHLRDQDLVSALKEIIRVLVPHGHLYGREPSSPTSHLAAYSPSVSFILMCLLHWVYVRTRTLVRSEPPVPGYHTSYNAAALLRHLRSAELKVEDLRLKFPVSAFFQHVGTGACRPRLRLYKKISQIARDADAEFERHRRYGNEIFYRAIKHSYDLIDIKAGVEAFLEEEKPPHYEVLRFLLKLIFRVAIVVFRIRV